MNGPEHQTLFERIDQAISDAEAFVASIHDSDILATANTATTEWLELRETKRTVKALGRAASPTDAEARALIMETTNSFLSAQPDEGSISTPHAA